MSMIFTLGKENGQGRIQGKCVNCGKAVFESLSTLDDAYNVWAGRCPHCEAINMLALTGLRGYSSQGMDLVLPFDEEVKANDLPEGTPTQGKGGEPNVHGSVLGEMLHKLKESIK